MNPKCPNCSSTKTCPIFYGYPVDIEAYLEGEAKGEFVGGGCCVSEDNPAWYCHDCMNRWGYLDTD